MLIKIKPILLYNKYLKTKNYLGYSPKINSYNNRNLEIEIESLYNEKQFHFLINFFYHYFYCYDNN